MHNGCVGSTLPTHGTDSPKPRAQSHAPYPSTSISRRPYMFLGDRAIVRSTRAVVMLAQHASRAEQPDRTRARVDHDPPTTVPEPATHAVTPGRPQLDRKVDIDSAAACVDLE